MLFADDLRISEIAGNPEERERHASERADGELRGDGDAFVLR